MNFPKWYTSKLVISTYRTDRTVTSKLANRRPPGALCKMATFTAVNATHTKD